ncbi:protein Mpv17-like [Anthonomus grandis grandis]|uniref:protein Mpv17-like n=1 Tax=Anthonomus grandis grandis TaxID=2921223 RepID=UPI002166A986|nr:protein Mpv17-like [Anthonomus grandis grandis]
MSLLRTYRHLLKNHFVVIQAAQTGLLMGVGDVLAQTVVEKKSFKEYKVQRTAKFVFLGVAFVGPTLSLWYKLLARKFGTQMSPALTLKKVACDQLLFAPSFLAVFITNINLLNGRSFDLIKKELSSNYKDLLVANWKLWPAVQLINFYVVPLNYQVLVVQSVAILWNTYLSWKTHS